MKQLDKINHLILKDGERQMKWQLFWIVVSAMFFFHHLSNALTIWTDVYLSTSLIWMAVWLLIGVMSVKQLAKVTRETEEMLS